MYTRHSGDWTSQIHIFSCYWCHFISRELVLLSPLYIEDKRAARTPGPRWQQPTSAHVEAKRSLAISAAVELLPVQQLPCIVDGNSVPDHRPFSAEPGSLHHLQAGEASVPLKSPHTDTSLARPEWDGGGAGEDTFTTPLS